jgi:hypothetical protein
MNALFKDIPPPKEIFKIFRMFMINIWEKIKIIAALMQQRGIIFVETPVFLIIEEIKTPKEKAKIEWASKIPITSSLP